jgi:hypothetical protein
MAKPGPAPKPSKSPPDLLIYVIGAVIVIVLLAFSLSRVMRKPATPSTTSNSALVAAPTPSEPVAGQSGDIPSVTLPPVVSPRSGEMTPPGALVQPPLQPAVPTQAALAAVPRVSSGDLLKMVEARQVTIIDVRDADSYRARHIPGALHIPLQYIAGEVPYLPKDKPIVTYCT